MEEGEGEEMRRRTNIVDEVMNEHVPMLGMPQVIVTRGFCYQWLKNVYGWDMKAKGFASLDYAAFGRRETDKPLTTEHERDYLLNLLAKAVA